MLSAVKLSEDKVFIAHSNSNSYYLYGMICTIEGSTITAVTDTELSSKAYRERYAISTVLLSNNKVFIVHSSDSNYYLYGVVCTIKGSTITAGIDTQLSTTNYTGYVISAVLLSNKVFVAHSYGSNSFYLYGMIATNTTVNTLSNEDEITGIAKTSGTTGQTVKVYTPNYN